MRCEIEDFKIGWFGLQLAFRPDEIDRLIANLQELKAGTLGHFHFRKDHWDEATGVADIELSLLGPDEQDNMTV